MFCNTQSWLSPPRALIGFAIVSVMALAAAFTAQFGWGLQPCVLCLYQRWPYAIVIVLCLAGLFMKNVKGTPIILGLIGVTFFINAIIAFYHSGVERKWWVSFLEGCSIPEMKGSITDVLAQIEATPIARCDEIPWTDPVFGLSMANYNVGVCLALTLLAAATLCKCCKNRS